VLARLVRNPLVVGIGAGAVLIIGSASAVLAQVGPTPGVTPTASGTATPSAPQPLTVTLKRTGTKTDGEVSAGTTVPMAADVTAGTTDLKSVQVTFSATAPATATPDASDQCPASTHVCTLDVAANTTVPIPLTVAVNTASGTFHVKAVAATVSLNSADSFPLTVSDPSSNHNPGGGTDGGGTDGKKPTKKPSTGHTGGSNGGSTGGSGGSNTTGGSTGNVPPSGTLTPPGTTGVTPPSTAPQPGAVLPSIGAQPPSTAGDPSTVNAGNSQSMRGKAEGPDELTFNKLASTQAAWLAALLVAFSLLLTQVRLGRTSNRVNRAVGVHRRLRRRMRRPRSH
jgi:hypothetical protein